MAVPFAGVDYNVHQAGLFYHYAIILYKGLNVVTKLGYEVVVPSRHNEMAMSIVAVLIQIVVEAYILGEIPT